jgi:hypothetical protein
MLKNARLGFFMAPVFNYHLRCRFVTGNQSGKTFPLLPFFLGQRTLWGKEFEQRFLLELARLRNPKH